MNFNNTINKIKTATEEYWNEFVSQIPGIIIAIIIIALGILLANFISSLLEKRYLKKLMIL